MRFSISSLLLAASLIGTVLVDTSDYVDAAHLTSLSSTSSHLFKRTYKVSSDGENTDNGSSYSSGQGSKKSSSKKNKKSGKKGKKGKKHKKKCTSSETPSSSGDSTDETSQPTGNSSDNDTSPSGKVDSSDDTSYGGGSSSSSSDNGDDPTESSTGSDGPEPSSSLGSEGEGYNSTSTGKEEGQSGSPTYGGEKSPGNADGKGRMVAYYVDWMADQYKPSDIPLDKLTHINYAFGIPKESGDITLESMDTLKQVVSAAKSKNVKVLVSVGGASDSKPFSSIVKNDGARSKFVESCKKFADAGVDGIDIDWEIPKDNEVADLIKLITAIRQGIKKTGFLITMAVPSYQLYTKDASLNKQLANSVDFINIMSYDVHLPDSDDKTGVNSPYEDPKDQDNSFCGSEKIWTSYFDPSKVVMGFPFNGYGWPIAPGKDVSSPTGQKMEDKSRNCGDSVSDDNQTWMYRMIVDKVGTEGSPKDGWTISWDDASSTPYAVNKDKGILLSYDDPKSLKIKAKHAQETKLGGGMIWSIDMDKDGQLLEAIDCLRTGQAC